MGNAEIEANIAKNKHFLETLGLGNDSTIKVSSLMQQNASSSRQKAASTDNSKGTRQSTRNKRMREKEVDDNIEEYRCKKCNIDKTFQNLHGLHLHQSRHCPAAINYKPKGFCQFTEDEYNKIFSLNPTSQTTLKKTRSFTSHQMPVIEQDVFDMINCPNEDIMDECNTLNMEGTVTEKPPTSATNDAILSFANLQSKLCGIIIFIKCSKLLTDTSIYNFYLESGLSRKYGNKLLSLIRSFNPAFTVPRSIKGIESRVKKSMKQYNDCIKLSVPWVQKWKMNELKGFQPVKIYVRNLFEVISHMLVDPEIMFLWRSHIHLEYYRATDQQGNQVYSDVMSSNWALGSEIMVHQKDPNGYLMPLIFYTDGVQVSNSVHNKITPVIVSLGNFSDSLLQKDLSKRVVAYLPNLKCYSKALMVSHIISKCGISKTKVTDIVSHVISDL